MSLFLLLLVVSRDFFKHSSSCGCPWFSLAVNSGSIHQERSLKKAFVLLPAYMCSCEKHQHLYFCFCLCDLWFGLCLEEVFSVLDLFVWFALCCLIDRLMASPCYLGLSYFGERTLSFGCLPSKALESEFFILFVF